MSNLRASANSHCLKGDYAKAFECLRAVKRSVIQSFRKQEREALKQKEKEFEECLSIRNFIKPIGFSNQLNFPKEFFKEESKVENVKKEILNKIKNIVPLYEQYNEMLSDLLEKYGYLIPIKEDASKMTFGNE